MQRIGNGTGMGICTKGCMHGPRHTASHKSWECRSLWRKLGQMLDYALNFLVSTTAAELYFSSGCTQKLWCIVISMSSSKGIGQVHPVWNGYVILLNNHVTFNPLCRHCMTAVLWLPLLTFACLARHPANCITAFPTVFSRDLQVCQYIRS